MLHAVFRPHLAMTPLRFANPSPSSGWIEDFHLQAVVHTRHTARGPPAEKKAGGSHHRSGRKRPALPARWLYDLYAISLGTGCLAPITRRQRSPQTCRLDLSTGRPGPRDFTVRAGSFVGATIGHAATRHAHRIPLPTSVTTAIRPLRRNGTGWTIMLIWRSRQRIYFYPKGWTAFATGGPICPTGGSSPQPLSGGQRHAAFVGAAQIGGGPACL